MGRPAGTSIAGLGSIVRPGVKTTMARIVTTVLAASRRGLLWLFRKPAVARRRRADPSDSRARQIQAFTIDTLFGHPGLVMTPAQAAAFATRSFTWRCVSCGKVHAFDRPVRVGAASPCSCLQIEFETDARRRPARYAALRGLPEG
jgi:hypothetical protein